MTANGRNGASMYTLAVYNMKGGVGKTATAVNLATLAADSGLRTLLWDLDPQASASWYFDDTFDNVAGKREWLGKSPIGSLVRKTAYPLLDLLPSGTTARHLDIWLRKAEPADGALRRLLQPLSESYALVVLDCPPSLSYLADNIFAASDRVLVPVVPAHLSLRALMTLIEHFKASGLPRKRLKPVYSMVDRRRLLHRALVEHPPKTMQDVCRTVIPYAAAVERMGSHREPLEAFDPSSPAAEAYRQLWDELKGPVRRA